MGRTRPIWTPTPLKRPAQPPFNRLRNSPVGPPTRLRRLSSVQGPIVVPRAAARGQRGSSETALSPRRPRKTPRDHRQPRAVSLRRGPASYQQGTTDRGEEGHQLGVADVLLRRGQLCLVGSLQVL